MASKDFLCTVHAMKPSASLETWQGVAEEARRQQSKVRVPWRTGLGSGGKDIPTPSSRCLTLVCSVFPSSILPKPAPSFHPIFKSIWKPVEYAVLQLLADKNETLLAGKNEISSLSWILACKNVHRLNRSPVSDTKNETLRRQNHMLYTDTRTHLPVIIGVIGLDLQAYVLRKSPGELPCPVPLLPPLALFHTTFFRFRLSLNLLLCLDLQ
jgi:hypothetical protein